MSIPSSLDQVILFVLFVLPGITFSTVRTALTGWRAPDFSVGARILEALFISALFDGVYLVIFGELIARYARANISLLAFALTGNIFLLLVALIVVPGLLGWVASLGLHREARVTKGGKEGWRIRKSANNYRSTPQAWDFKVLDAGGLFVRVRLENGTYYGGWYSSQSLASTYPQPRDLFIESQWKLNANGDFVGKMTNTRGVWIPINDKTVVEWIGPSTPEKEIQHDERKPETERKRARKGRARSDRRVRSDRRD